MSLLPNYNKFFAAGLGTIYSQQWDPAPAYEGRKKLLAVPPIKNLAYWQVQIRPQGEIYLPTELITPWIENTDVTNPPNVQGFDVPLDKLSILQAADQVSQLGGLSRLSTSMLKVRMTWKDDVATRCIDFDLGAGVDFVTPPSHWVEAELLIPVPDTGFIPPTVQARIPLGFGTSVIARADCVPQTSLRDHNLVYTDVRYQNQLLNGDTARVPRRKAATRAQVFFNRIPAGTVRFIHDRNPPGAAVDVFGRLVTGRVEPLPGGGAFPGRGTSTGHVDIPGMANAIEVEIAAGEPENTFTVVQELAF